MIAKMKQGILSVARAPMSVYLRAVERGIPKVHLTSRQLENATLLPDRKALLELLPSNAIVAELGVDEGGFSQLIREICTPRKLHLVDFWGSRRYNLEKKQRVYSRFDTALKEGSMQIHLGLSTAVVDQFDEQYFDWIYIDTDHTYKTTRDELELYRDRIKPGGIIAGHDYIIGNWTGMRRYGVMEAVHEFCLKYDWEILYLTTELDIPPSFAIRSR